MNIEYQKVLADLLSAYEVSIDTSDADSYDFEVLATSDEQPYLEDGEELTLVRKLQFSLFDFELLSNDLEQLTNNTLSIGYRGNFTLENNRHFSISLVQAMI